MNNLLPNTSVSLDKTFAALADPTRRAIITRLAKGSATVNEIAAPYDISLPAISKHLKVLEKAGLLNRRKEGRIYHCSLNADPLKGASSWLDFYQQFWEDQLDALAEFIEASTSKDNPDK
jgi:DNA-binding transcriptional ArsR family regulator